MVGAALKKYVEGSVQQLQLWRGVKVVRSDIGDGYTTMGRQHLE